MRNNIRLHFLSLTLFSLISYTYAGSYNYPVGARSAAMANTSVMISDIWSIHHNQAGLAYLENPIIGFHHETKFLTREFSLQSMAFALPTKSGVFGASLSYFGYTKYNESKVGLAYAHKLGDKISAGIQLNYMNTHVAGLYEDKGAAVAEIGIRTEPIENLFIGVHLFNPTRAKIDKYTNEYIPTIFRFGGGYHFPEKAFIGVETEKSTDQKPIFKAGIEYKLIKDLYLRTGISSNPTQNTFGLGYKRGRLSVDIAFSTHQILGITPHFSINYTFK